MPLWAQLQQDLRRRLASGEFDDVFPGEMDLVQAYDVSRHTVRVGLRRLREVGVLESGRGRGTQVRRVIEQPLGSLYSLFREVEPRGMRQTSQVLALRREANALAATALGLSAEAELVHLERVVLADDLAAPATRPGLPTGRAAGLAGDRVVEHRVTLVRGDRCTVVADWSTRGYAVGAATA